ncbi:ParB/RepB/Spo0J family partition protein [Cupriavidus taiwanensis]|uniref:ParB/RepB/Spo0J family partition protein n=1 Tax=Cupriavidus taiwanensis TaxID=164546 RepID=UPI0039C2A25F
MTTLSNTATPQQIPLSLLVLSPRNSRQTSPKAINELAALLASQGQLQNLIVTEEITDDAPTGRYEVIAGGRRWRAMQLLVQQGHWNADHLVDVKLRDSEQAEEVSLAENSAREAMHPADEFEAFKHLIDAGTAIEDVAARFGVSPLVVQRRLRLANVSPRMIQVYRDGDASLEQLMALAITDDHKAQERVWKAAVAHWDRTPEKLRRKLAKGEVEVRDSKLAKFVTLEAYEAAGGHVERDLFSDAGNGYLADEDLLEQLASDKLEAAAADLRADGWAWVDVKPDFQAYRVDYDYERLDAVEGTPDKAQKARIKALEQEQKTVTQAVHELEAADNYGEQYDTLTDRRGEITDELATITASLLHWPAVDKARSGAILAITDGGILQIHRGLVQRSRGRSSSASDDDAAGDTTTKKAADKATLSASLASRLTAHRTNALQLHLVEQPTLALAVLVHGMVLKLFRDATYKFATLSALDLSVSDKIRGLPAIADDLEASPVWTRLQDLRTQILAGLPKADSALLTHLIALPQQDLLQLLALCTAASISAVATGEGPRAADAVAEAAGLDMADWWTATAGSYLNFVPKTMAIEAVTEACGKKAAAPLASMKKADLAAKAEELLAGTRWLPKILRGPKKATPKAAPSNKTGRPAVRYRDENGNTWTGRGKRPGWVEAALKDGKTLDELLPTDAQEAEA